MNERISSEMEIPLLQQLTQKLEQRKQDGLFRSPQVREGYIDFSSNDYLGLARSAWLWQESCNFANSQIHKNGSTGSRLLTGNSRLYEETEEELASFYEAEAALLFNSGYAANLGLYSCLLQRSDTWIYDELCHASIRDGLRLSPAKSWSFAHNNLEDLNKKLQQAQGNKIVAIETIYSMNGDQAPLREILGLCENHHAHLVIDEAHATGVMGEHGKGLAHNWGVAHRCLARVYTFGKALGAQGAAVLGSQVLKDYLLNFARSLIYTTALPPYSVCAIRAAHRLLPNLDNQRRRLAEVFNYFKMQTQTIPALRFQLEQGPIAILYTPTNEFAHAVANYLQSHGIDARAILSPTVPAGRERIRFCLHAYNSFSEIDQLFALLQRLEVPTSIKDRLWDNALTY
jgi:8-amino-7-oxononanoate synthase